MIKKFSILFLILIAVFTLTACDSVSDSRGSGDLALSLADKPVNDVAQVLVTIEEVQVVRENDRIEVINDFSDLENGEKEFDLMALRFDEELLGQESLEAGFYNEIRLIVAAYENDTNPTTSGKSRVVYTNGDDENIFIPSGAQTGLKINHNFEIREDTITRLLLDVDVSQVMHQAGASGKIILRPTAIDVIDEIVSGTILGKVVDVDGGFSFTNDVVVEVYNSDDTIADADPIKSTVATAEAVNNQEAGSYLIRGLEAGTYKLYAYTADGTGAPAENNLNGILENVEVTEGEQTDLIAEDRNIIVESNVQ